MIRKMTPPPTRPHCSAESPRGKSELPLEVEFSPLVPDPVLDDALELPPDDPVPLEAVAAAFPDPVADPFVVDAPAEPLFVALKFPPPAVVLSKVDSALLESSVLALTV